MMPSNALERLRALYRAVLKRNLTANWKHFNYPSDMHNKSAGALLEQLEPRLMLSATSTSDLELRPAVEAAGDYTLSTTQQTNIDTGLAALESAWAGISSVGDLADNLNLFDSSLGDLFDVSSQLNDGFINPSQAFFDSAGDDATLSDWADALIAANQARATDTLNAAIENINIPEFSELATDVWIEFDYSLEMDVADWNIPLSELFEEYGFDAFGFDLTVEDLDIDINATLDFTVRLGVSDTLGFYIAPTSFTVGTSFSADLPISIDAGMFELETGTVTGDGPSFTLSLVDPGTQAGSDGKITYSEISGVSAVGDLVSASLSAGDVEIDVPLVFNSDVFGDLNDASLVFAAADAVNDLDLSLTASDIGSLVRNLTLDPQTLATELYRFSQSLTSMTSLDIMQQYLPFVEDTQVRDILDFAEGIAEGLGSSLYTLPADDAVDGTPIANFSSWDELITSLTGFSDTVTYDAATRELVFDIDYQYDFTAIDMPLDLSMDLGLFSLSTSSQLQLGGSVGYSFQLGIEIAPLQQLMLTGSAETAATDDPANAILNGKLNSDAVVEVALDVWDSAEITVTQAVTSDNNNLLDLVDDFNDAIAGSSLAGKVEAVLVNYVLSDVYVTSADYSDPDFDGTGRIGFITVGEDNWSLQVRTDASNIAATALGFQTSESVTPTYAEMFIDNTGVTAEVTLQATDIDATGDFGIVEISVLDGEAGITASASSSVVHPTTGASRVTISELFANANKWQDMISLSLTGSGEIAFENIQVAGLGGLDMGLSPSVVLAVEDINNPTDITVSYDGFGNLANLSSLSVSDVLNALSQGVEVLSSIDALEFLNFDIPLINMNVVETLDMAGDFATYIEGANNTAQEGGSLQLLDGDLAEIFGLGSGGPAFSLSLDGTNIKLEIDYELIVTETMEFSANLDDLFDLVGGDTAAFDMLKSVVDIGGATNILVEGMASVHLVLGLDLSDVSNPRTFLYDETDMALGVRAAADDVNLTFAVGPLSMSVKDGWAVIDNDGDISTHDYAEFTVALDDNDGDGRHYFDAAAPFTDDMTTTLTAECGIELPLYFPTDSMPLGGFGNNIFSLDIDSLADVALETIGSVSIETPDLSGLFSGLNILQVLDNPAIILDGIQGGFDMAQQAVTDVIDSINLPIVGEYLSGGVDFVDELADELLEYLRTGLNEIMDGKTSTELIREALFYAFGPSGLNILRDATGDSSITVDDVLLEIDDTEWQYVEYRLDLGQDVFEESLNFDLGIDALPIGLEGEVQASMSWDWSLGFGIDVTDGFYLIDEEENEMSIGIDVTMPETLTGDLFFLEAAVTSLDDSGAVDYTASLLGGEFFVDFVDPGDDGKITIADIRNNSASDLISAGFQGGLDANLEMVLSIGGSDQFPRIRTVVELDWSYNKTFGQTSVSTSPSIEFTTVQLDLGSFISGYLKPVLDKIDEVIDPFRPVLDFLTDDLPIIEMSLCEIGEMFGYGQYTQFIEAVDWVSDLVADIASIPDGELWIDMGSFSLDPDSGSISEGSTLDFNSSLNANSGASSSTKSFMTNATTGNSNFTLNILEPSTIFDIIMGNDATLMTFSIPDLSVSAGYSQSYPVYGPLCMVLGGSVSASLHLGFGYDTYGIRKASETGNYAYIMDGFYISDRENADGTGADVPEATASLDLYAGAELNVVVAKGGVKGGINGEIGVNLNDPDNDGKVRMTELVGNMLEGIDHIVDVNILIEAYVEWYVTIGFGPFSKTFDGTIVDVTLYEETWSASSTPVLASDGAPGEIVINMGDFATDRLHGDKSGGSETFTITAGSGTTGYESLRPTVGTTDYRPATTGSNTLYVTFGGITQEISYNPGDTIVIDAGAGDDTVIIGAGVQANVIFNGGTGNDYIEMRGDGWLQADGGAGNDTIIGGSYDDTLVGGDGNDTITGNGGNDTITGGAGNDTLNGGAGNDTYIFDVAFGDDTITDSAGSDHADLSGSASQLTLDVTTQRLDNQQGDSVVFDTILETVTGSSASDIIIGRDEDNLWHITGGDEGTYNGEFTFRSFEQLIGRSQDDHFVFDDAAYISDLIEGGSGLEDDNTSSYEVMVSTDIIDLSAYTTSNRWQVSGVDSGQLILAYASPQFSGVESHYGGSANDYLVISNDAYITGLFDGNGGLDRIELSDYQLVGTYKVNEWDFVGLNTGSVNQRTAFTEVENFNGGENEDIFNIHPAGEYAAGFLHTPGGTGGKLSGSIEAENETDTINNSPSYKEEIVIPVMQAAALTADTLDTQDQDLRPAVGEVSTDDYDVIWHITGENSGTRTADGTTVTFSSTQNIDGSSGNDLFIIHTGGSLDGYINGQGGDDAIVYGWDGDEWTDQVSIDYQTSTKATATAIGGYIENIELIESGSNTNDTFSGSDIANVWNITSDNAGRVGTYAVVNFVGFENIAGGSGDDTFLFASGAVVDGSVSGGEGDDLIDMSTFNSDVEWDITAENSGTLAIDGGSPIAFSGIESLSGSQGDDVFEFGASGVLTGSISGNSGQDELDYSLVSTAMTWSINAQNAGQISRVGGATDFDGIEDIYAGTGNDTFVFADGMGLDGHIDAGDGTDTFDYSDYSVVSPVSVDLEALTATGVSSFAAVEQFIGGSSMSNTLTGKDGVTSLWTISDWDDGNIAVDGIATPFVFFDFQILNGGSGDDTFDVADTKYVHGPISGGGGNDTLDFEGYSLIQSWTIDAVGGGMLAMDDTRDPLRLAFDGIENIITGSAYNYIYMEDGAQLSSLIGEGIEDRLYFSDYSSAVTVNFETMSMIGSDYFEAIEIFYGSDQQDTLIGEDDRSNEWAIVVENGGILNPDDDDVVLFADFENITGGSGDDSFVFSDGASVTGAIDGAGEVSGNTLDYSAYTTEVEVNLNDTAATGIGQGWSNIRNVIGGSGVDTLIAVDQANTVAITDDDAGTINTGETNFTSFGNLTGGSATDTFVFTDAKTLSGVVDGAGGENTLDYSANTTAVIMDLQNKAVTGTAGYDNILNLIAGTTGEDKIIGANASYRWAVTGVNAGTIGSLALVGSGETTLLNFTEVENLTGGTGNDVFVIDDGASIDGSLDGGDGWDKVSYEYQSSGITVNRQLGQASHTGGYLGVEEFVGSSQADTLIGLDAAATWNVTGMDSGNIGGADVFRFSAIENLTGGSDADDFVLSDGVYATGMITGSGGNDSLNLADYSAGGRFDVDTDNAGTAIDQDFQQVENLVGTQGDDVFAMADGVGLTGTIDGQGGTDELDYSAYTTSVLMNRQAKEVTGLAGYDSIESLAGGSALDTLVGRDVAALWDIDGANTGDVDDGFAFRGVENLTGGSAADKFNFIGAGSIDSQLRDSAGDDTVDMSQSDNTVSLNLENKTITGVGDDFDGIENFIGSANSDTITGPNVATTWNVTDNNAGNVNGAYDFESFENLTGGTADDTFVLSDGMGVTGVIDGGGEATGNTLDYSAYTTEVEVNVNDTTATNIGQIWSNIRNVIGGSEVDTLIASSASNNTVAITGDDAGTINSGETNFTSFGNLTGGGLNDTFIFSDARTISGIVDGGVGDDTLDYSAYTTAVTMNLQDQAVTGTAGYADIENIIGGLSGDDNIIGVNGNYTWTVTGHNEGNVASLVLRGEGDATLLDFSDVENLTGGEQNDLFVIDDGGSLDGTIDGVAGWDRISYENQSTGVTINRQLGQTSHIGGYQNVEEFIGSAQVDTLIGLDAAATWNITGENSGNIGGEGVFRFSAIESLTGGSAADVFNFIGAGSIGSQLRGSEGDDTVDMSQSDNTVSLDLENKAVTGVGDDFDDIENFVGSANSDTITGPDVATTWNVTGNDAGNVNGAYDFESFENLTGGTADDTFILSDGVGLSGSLDAGAGIDTMDYSAYTTKVSVNLNDSTATGIAGTVTNVDEFIGGSGGSDEITGQNVDTQWNITGDDSGRINDTVDFSSFEVLTGGTANDTFSLIGDGSVSNLIDGGDGTDVLDYENSNYQLAADMRTQSSAGVASFTNIEGFGGSDSSEENTVYGSNQNTVWLIEADGTVNDVTNGLFYFGVDNIVAGTANDLFMFEDGAALPGDLDAGGGDGLDVLDFSAYTTAIVFDLDNQTTTPVGGTTSGFKGLIGGSASDTLVAPAGDNTWEITADNEGTLNGYWEWRSIENLTGNSGSDTFEFAQGVGIDGTLDAGEGTSVLDYSAYTTEVVVDLQQGLATGTGSIANINEFIGGSAFDRIIGRDIDNTWNITGDDQGNINGEVTFSSFGSLWGGSAKDNFIFADGVVVTSDLHGNDGIDQIDFSAYTTYNTWENQADDSILIETNFGDFYFNSIEDYLGGTSVFLFPNQDLKIEFDDFDLPEVMVPGESAELKITVKNLSNVLFKGKVNITAYASVDDVLDQGTDVVIGELTEQYVKVSQDQTGHYTMDILLPEDLPFDDYNIILMVDSTDVVEEIDEENNVAVSPYAVTVEKVFGNLNDGRNVPLPLTLADGTEVELTITGPGRGVMNGELDTIELFDTTSRTKLSVKIVNGVSDPVLGDITIHGDIGLIDATGCDLAGNITVEGSLGKLILDDLLDAVTNVITIGASDNSQDLVLTADELTDVVVASEHGIKSITATSWTDGDGNSDDKIDAADIGKVTIGGVMQADVVSGEDMDSLITGGEMSGDVDVVDDIGELRVIDGPLSGNVTAGGDLKKLLLLNGALVGNLDVGGDLKNMLLSAGNCEGSVSVDGDLLKMVVSAGNVVGDLDVDGDLKYMLLKAGDLQGGVTVDGQLKKLILSAGDVVGNMILGSVGNATIVGDILGDINVAGDFTKLIVNNIIGQIDVGGKMSSINVAGDTITGDINVGGDLKKFVAAQADLASDVEVGGSVSSLVLATLSGVFRNNELIKTVKIYGDLSGQLFSFARIYNIKIIGGNITGELGTNELIKSLDVIQVDGVGGAIMGLVESGDEIRKITTDAASTGQIHTGQLRSATFVGGWDGEIIADGTSDEFPKLLKQPNISNLRVVDGDLAGTITTVNFKNIFVEGGALTADITATGEGSRIHVTGGDFTSTVNVDSLGHFHVHDGVYRGHLNVTNDFFCLRAIAQADQLAMAAGSTLTVGGDMTRATLKGNVAGEWNLAGGLLKLKHVDGNIDGWTLNMTGENVEVRSFAVDHAVDMTVTGGASYRSLAVTDYQAGSFEAYSFRTIKSMGNWAADLTIGDDTLEGLAFKKLSVYGDASGQWDIWGEPGRIDIRGEDTVDYIYHAV